MEDNTEINSRILDRAEKLQDEMFKFIDKMNASRKDEHKYRDFQTLYLLIKLSEMEEKIAILPLAISV